MREGTYVIGRAPGEAHRRGGRGITLADPTVSQEHAELLVLAGTCYLTDLGSRNGTWRCSGAEPQPHEAGYVEPDELLRFGALDCRLADLLRDGPGDR